jgi:hypothetical protein
MDLGLTVKGTVLNIVLLVNKVNYILTFMLCITLFQLFSVCLRYDFFCGSAVRLLYEDSNETSGSIIGGEFLVQLRILLAFQERLFHG